MHGLWYILVKNQYRVASFIFYTKHAMMMKLPFPIPRSKLELKLEEEAEKRGYAKEADRYRLGKIGEVTEFIATAPLSSTMFVRYPAPDPNELVSFLLSWRIAAGFGISVMSDGRDEPKLRDCLNAAFSNYTEKFKYRRWGTVDDTCFPCTVTLRWGDMEFPPTSKRSTTGITVELFLKCK